MATPTTITVRVIASGGKYIGDDIGGAAVSIRDYETQELLAAGATQGSSGPNGPYGVMCASRPRTTPLPLDDTTSAFVATLALDGPRRVQVTAFGPLAARASANTVSVTTWVYPDCDMSVDNGLLLELPGLLCQFVSPPAHTTWPPAAGADDAQLIVANVAMMCGCPISYKAAAAMCPGGADAQPWQPDDFLVFAEVRPVPGEATRVPLKWDGVTAGRFTAPWSRVAPPGTYQLTVVAQQISTGNTGVDFSTVVIQAEPPTQPPATC